MFERKMTKHREGPWTIRLADGCERGTILMAAKHFCRVLSSEIKKIESVPGLWAVHEGGRSTVYGAEVAGERYGIKLFTDNRLLTRARTFLGLAKGRRAFCNGIRAMEKNLPVPPVYAYAERRPFGPNLVIMKLLPAIQMNLLIEDMLERGVDLTTDPFFFQLVESFARFTRRLHANSVYHKDFSPRNVLVRQEGQHIRLELIDLEDMVFSGSASDFKENIDHFSKKMARYVNQATLDFFLRTVNEVYEDQAGK